MTFGLGILWTGLTEAGALCGLIVGLMLGLLKFIFGNVYPPPECGTIDDRPSFVKLHFMWYGKSAENNRLVWLSKTHEKQINKQINKRIEKKINKKKETKRKKERKGIDKCNAKRD